MRGYGGKFWYLVVPQFGVVSHSGIVDVFLFVSLFFQLMNTVHVLGMMASD